jgi:hypothetical protein
LTGVPTAIAMLHANDAFLSEERALLPKALIHAILNALQKKESVTQYVVFESKAHPYDPYIGEPFQYQWRIAGLVKPSNIYFVSGHKN